MSTIPFPPNGLTEEQIKSAFRQMSDNQFETLHGLTSTMVSKGFSKQEMMEAIMVSEEDAEDFASYSWNPDLQTLHRFAAALGYKVTLVAEPIA